MKACIAVLCLIVAGIQATLLLANSAINPAEPQVANEIVLKSPNGEHSILIRATDQGCGIWAADKHGKFAALVVGHGQGAIIGVQDQSNHELQHMTTAMDTALYTNQHGRGLWLKPDVADRLLNQAEKDNRFREVYHVLNKNSKNDQ